MSILQGTTPSLEGAFDKADFLVGDVVTLELTISNNERLLYKSLNDVDVDAEANSFIYHFSEAETLALNTKVPLVYQWRFVFEDGNVVGTEKESIEVVDLMSDRELTT